MLTAMLSRIASSVLVLFLVSLIAFLLAALSPRHPEVYKVGADAPIETVERVRASLGLDRPLPEQYFDWLANALQGDLGRSYVSDLSVSSEIALRAPRTLMLVVMAVALAAVLGLSIGTFSAIYQGGWVDRLLTNLAGILQAVPGFWLGIMLVTLFALLLGWLPATGYVSPSVSLGDWLRSIILPTLALGLASTAAIARQLRGSLINEFQKDYMRSAVAQGYGRMQAALGLAIRNAMGPAVTVIGFQTIVKLSTVVVVEKVFAIDGLGSLALNAVFRGDTPMLLGCVTVFAVVVVLVNLLVDMTYGWISPLSRSAA